MAEPQRARSVGFSVIIPTRNRPQKLSSCLESFLRLEPPEQDWELLVVDDGGETSLDLLSGDLQRRLPVRTLWVKRAGPAAARNAGAQAAQGDFLAFTDDDCLVEPDWLRELAKEFARRPWDALGGRSLNPAPHDPGAAAWHLLIEFLYEYLRDDRGNCLLLVSNNAAYRRSAFESVGGFDPRFPWAASEDRDLSYRMRSAGFAQGYHPGAKVWHHLEHFGGGRYLGRQFLYGRGGYYFERNLRKAGAAKFFASLKGTRGSYHLALWRHLRLHQAPFSLAALVHVGHIAHRLGVLYEGSVAAVKAVRAADAGTESGSLGPRSVRGRRPVRDGREGPPRR